VISMLTLEQAVTEYFKLSRPQFCQNNPNVPTIFSAAAVSLATRMWVEGTDLMPATWFVALIGDPRSGKTAFYRAYFKLFTGTGVGEVPIGSPEAMLKDIAAVRHGYIYYDEVAHLAKLMNSYMGTLPTLLNKAYYLDTLSQTRMDNKKSVVVDAESYFIHVYFGGTPEDWNSIERNAPGGFVRRTLVIPVRGTIPFFQKAHKDRAVLNYISQLRAKLRKIFRELTPLDLTVYLPEFPELAEVLENTQMDREKKSMVEEYFYKLLAGRIVANLVTFNLEEDPHALDTNELVHRMIHNAEKLNVQVDVVSSTSTRVAVDIIVPEQPAPAQPDPKTLSLDQFMPPHYTAITFQKLLETVKPQVSAPDSLIMRNVERIRDWLEAGNPVVVSTRQFVQKILHTTNPQLYKPVLEVLEDGGYIRRVEFPYKGRTARYIILDTKARICGNCAFYRNPERCPLLKGCLDIEMCKEKVPPWQAACDKFEPAEQEEG